MNKELVFCTIIDYDNIHLIGAIDKNVIKTNVVSNPVKKLGSFIDIKKLYKIDKEKLHKILFNELTNLINDMLKELQYQSCNILGIATNAFFANILLNLPLDTKIKNYNSIVENENLFVNINKLYFFPIYNQLIGGDTICNLISLPDRSGIIISDNICIIGILDKEKDRICAMWDIEYNNLEIGAICGALKTVNNDVYKNPIIYLYGENKEKLFDMIEMVGFTHIEKEINYDYFIRGCVDQNFRRKLELQKDRLEYIELTNNEAFQQNFIDSTTHLF